MVPSSAFVAPNDALEATSPIDTAATFRVAASKDAPVSTARQLANHGSNAKALKDQSQRGVRRANVSCSSDGSEYRCVRPV